MLPTRYPVINKYWDRLSKVMILLVDAGLNFYFLRTVQKRLVRYHGLKKYAPLVSFNARLMALSIMLDVRYCSLSSYSPYSAIIIHHTCTSHHIPFFSESTKLFSRGGVE